jgi:L-aspartate oxidase
VAGAGLCKEEVVRTIVSEGPARIAELIRYGMAFTEREVPGHPGEKELDLGREGGHSKRRILHAKDMTGREVERALLAAAEGQPNIQIFEDHIAIDLITTRKLGLTGPNRCLGAYVLDKTSGQVLTFSAPAVTLATGGCGKVYLYTTNPDIATGDGVAMAYRAGASVANMEFVQFHPTCFYHPKAKSFLISEAVRGEGAVLRDLEGREFMPKYDSRRELAPRDIVARAIDSEMKRTGADYVLLDITHRPAPFIINRFPNIYATCLKYGLDMTKEAIPVVPAAHYQCGGVVTTVDGQTEIEGLYAVGEVACTGLHGANRLASTSLLEGLVFGCRAARAIGQALRDQAHPDWPAIDPWVYEQEPSDPALILQDWLTIKYTMWNYVGLARTTRRMKRARQILRELQTEVEDFYARSRLDDDLIGLRNGVQAALAILYAASQNRTSRGCHYLSDAGEEAPAPIPVAEQSYY